MLGTAQASQGLPCFTLPIAWLLMIMWHKVLGVRGSNPLSYKTYFETITVVSCCQCTVVRRIAAFQITRHHNLSNIFNSTATFYPMTHGTNYLQRFKTSFGENGWCHNGTTLYNNSNGENRSAGIHLGAQLALLSTQDSSSTIKNPFSPWMRIRVNQTPQIKPPQHFVVEHITFSFGENRRKQFI